EVSRAHRVQRRRIPSLVYTLQLGSASSNLGLFSLGQVVMRILVVADIHGNWPALQALNEPHDLCLCLGDLVDYALEAKPCIDWVRRNAGHTIRGNHDHGMAQDVTVL